MQKMSSLKKKTIINDSNKNETGGILMTIPPVKKRKKMIKIETENTKKEREEIQKQNEIKLQIKEIEDKIAFQKEQHNIVMSIKKEELSRKEKSIETIENANKKY